MGQTQAANPTSVLPSPDSLGILREPVLTPCYHAFCRECIDQMLRVAQKTDAPCPICKGRLTRRSLLAAGAWEGLVQTFGQLAATLEAETGRKWDDPDEEDDDDGGGAPSSDIATTQVSNEADPGEIFTWRSPLAAARRFVGCELKRIGWIERLKRSRS